MPLASAPQFGSNTRIALPNAASDLVDALRLLLTFTENTPGGERSKWTLQTAFDGVLYDTLSIRASVEMGVPSKIFFLYDTDTGIEASAANTIAVRVGGNQTLFVNSSGALLNASLGANVRYGWGGHDSGLFYDQGTGNLAARPSSTAGNVDLGIGAGALANNATHGFVTLPVCAGTPIGAPTVTAGQAALVVGNFPSAPQLFAWNGSAWGAL